MTQQERSRKAREKWHDRRPVIVPPDKYDLWLDPDVTGSEAIRDILKPNDANLVRRYPFSMKLSNSRIDNASTLGDQGRPIR